MRPQGLSRGRRAPTHRLASTAPSRLEGHGACANQSAVEIGGCEGDMTRTSCLIAMLAGFILHQVGCVESTSSQGNGGSAGSGGTPGGAANGVNDGKCTGSPWPCDTLEDPTSCIEQACRWEYDSFYKEDRCRGPVLPCGSHTTRDSCLSSAGCSYEQNDGMVARNEGCCTASVACETLSESDCASYPRVCMARSGGCAPRYSSDACRLLTKGKHPTVLEGSCKGIAGCSFAAQSCDDTGATGPADMTGGGTPGGGSTAGGSTGGGNTGGGSAGSGG